MNGNTVKGLVVLYFTDRFEVIVLSHLVLVEIDGTWGRLLDLVLIASNLVEH